MTAIKPRERTQRPHHKVGTSALQAVALILALLCPWLAEVQAQAPIPCPDCRPMLRPTHPESGPWYNPAEPGAGFVFEIQNGKLAGFYYGYDANGAPVWWLLNAPLLAAPDDPEVDWVYEVTPLRFDGGGCIDCAYTAPTTTPQAQSLRIEFLNRNYARYRVAGGNWKPIYSLAFGTRVYDYFAGVTDFPVPDLTGAWVFVFQLPTEASDPNNPSDRYGLLGGRPAVFRVVRYLPATDDSATVCGNLRAGVAQASREETAGVC